MKCKNLFSYLMILSGIFLLPFFGKAQNCDPLDARQLKTMLEQLGYTVKELSSEAGKEKFEVLHNKGGYDIPVAYEISASRNFVWLTAFLGNPKDENSITNASLLKQNFKIQPCQFYITEKGKLMMGLAVENRGLTNSILRRHTDKIVSDVSNTVSLWQ